MDSTSTFDLLAAGQASKELTANNLLNGLSPAGMFAKRDNTTGGLVWGYYGGFYWLAGVLTAIANGTVTLTASLTNYLELNLATGAVTANTTAFTAGRLPLYSIVCGATSVTSYVDYRNALLPRRLADQRMVLAMANVNQTLNADQASCLILELTGALTALRDVVVPIVVARQWTVFANVAGGFGVRVIGASGTGITVADGKRAILYTDTTNVVRVTADT